MISQSSVLITKESMFKLEDPSQLTAATVVGAAGGRVVRLSAAQSKIFFGQYVTLS